MTVRADPLQYSGSVMIAEEAVLTAGVQVQQGRQYGFFTDTTVCIGCKACEVACKEWNLVPEDGLVWTGESYDNTSTRASIALRAL